MKNALKYKFEPYVSECKPFHVRTHEAEKHVKHTGHQVIRNSTEEFCFRSYERQTVAEFSAPWSDRVLAF